MKTIKFHFILCVILYRILISVNAEAQDTKPSQTVSAFKKNELNQKRMLAYLASNKNKADFVSIGGIMINDKGVKYFQSILDTAKGNDILKIKTELANQLLESGKNDEAAEMFQNILTDTSIAFRNNIPLQTNIRKSLALSFFRKGEQFNCITNHSSESCILPIRGNGIYTYTEATKRAIKIYTDLLSETPADLESRWMLNIAYMTLGLYPDSVPAKYFIELNKSEKEQDLPQFKDIAIDLGLDVNDMSGSVCMEDFDNDGFLDLFMTAEGFDSPLKYFHNNGNGSFSDKSIEAGLEGEVSARVCVQADYNNDGYTDIFVCRGAWQIQENNYPPNSLLRNNGDGTFSDVTIESGLLSFYPTYCASWGDFNNDGWIDLFVSNETITKKFSHPSQLYRNNGNGTFTDVSSGSGINVTGWMKGVVWGDYNNDGWQDLYLSTFKKGHKLYKNNGVDMNGQVSFSDVTDTAGVNLPIDGLPAMFFDYNNDGWTDIFASSFYSTENTNVPLEYLGEKPDAKTLAKLFRNNKDGTFSDVSKTANLNKVIHAMGINFGDIDNDGFPDIYAGTGDLNLSYVVPNLMFQNINGNTFKEVGGATRTASIQKGHGIAFGDIDNDGDQDIYEVMGGGLSGDRYPNNLYENPGNQNNWINIKLIGKRSNRSAIGARIKITIEKDGKEVEIHSTVNTGASFGASSLQQEIGLGRAARIIKINIHWPSSKTDQEFRDVKMNQFYRVEEQNPNMQLLKKKIIRFGKKDGGSPKAGEHHGK